MSREEQIRQQAELYTKAIYGEIDDFVDVIYGYIDGAKWADENPKHYSFKEAMDACMGSYEAGGKELLYVANQTAERTKKEVISKACKWLENRHNIEKSLGILTSRTEDLSKAFKQAMEE